MKAAERRMRLAARRLRSLVLHHGLSPSMRCTVLDLYDTIQAAVARGDGPEATILNCGDLLVSWYAREAAR